MTYTGNMPSLLPPRYLYQCPRCNHQAVLKERYPLMRWERAEPDLPPEPKETT